MKNLVALFSSLIIVGLIASCSTSTDPNIEEKDVFEPYTVGSFKITSPTTAEYIGVSNAKILSKTDSSVIDSIGDFQLSLERDTLKEEGRFDLTFIDSSFTSQPDSIDQLETVVHFQLTNYKTSNKYHSGSSQWRITNTYSRLTQGITYSDCVGASSGETDLIIEYYNHNDIDIVYKHYLIKTSNFENVVSEIACD